MMIYRDETGIGDETISSTLIPINIPELLCDRSATEAEQEAITQTRMVTDIAVM